MKLGRLLRMAQTGAWARMAGRVPWSYPELVAVAAALGVTVAELVTPDEPPAESDSSSS